MDARKNTLCPCAYVAGRAQETPRTAQRLDFFLSITAAFAPDACPRLRSGRLGAATLHSAPCRLLHDVANSRPSALDAAVETHSDTRGSSRYPPDETYAHGVVSEARDAVVAAPSAAKPTLDAALAVVTHPPDVPLGSGPRGADHGVLRTSRTAKYGPHEGNRARLRNMETPCCVTDGPGFGPPKQ